MTSAAFPTEQWTEIATVVRGRRLSLGKSIEEMTRAAGVSRSTWEVFERGWRAIAGGARADPNPRPANTARVAGALDVDASVLMNAIAGSTEALYELQRLGPPRALEDRGTELPPGTAATTGGENVIDVSGLPEEDKAMLRAQRDRLRRLHGIED